MKIFNSAFTVSRRFGLIGILGLLAFNAGAVTHSPSPAVQTVGGNAGSIASVRTSQQGDKFLVAGSARPILSAGGIHVDIELIAADGRLLAAETEALKLGHPRGSRARQGSAPFVTSFPLATARQASSVRVTLHSSAH